MGAGNWSCSRDVFPASSASDRITPFSSGNLYPSLLGGLFLLPCVLMKVVAIWATCLGPVCANEFHALQEKNAKPYPR